jgi:hypothetical protein
MPQARNQRGPIAASYAELQAIEILVAAWRSSSVEQHSRASSLRAVLQSVEVLLLNLADLTTRAAANLRHGRLALTTTKLGWCLGIHRLATHLSFVASQVGIEFSAPSAASLPFADSPALADYVQETKDFDDQASPLLASDPCAIGPTTAVDPHDADGSARLFRAVSVCCHEATIWEGAFSAIVSPVQIADYGAFIDSRTIRAAVDALWLDGDTFITQFRGFHQIPELLSFEANAAITPAIRDLRAGARDAALCHTRMSERALSEDRMIDLARVFGVAAPSDGVPPLTAYLRSPGSLDWSILAARGATARARFLDVQNRTGRFSEPVRFSAPPKQSA